MFNLHLLQFISTNRVLGGQITRTVGSHPLCISTLRLVCAYAFVFIINLPPRTLIPLMWHCIVRALNVTIYVFHCQHLLVGLMSWWLKHHFVTCIDYNRNQILEVIASMSYKGFARCWYLLAVWEVLWCCSCCCCFCRWIVVTRLYTCVFSWYSS